MRYVIFLVFLLGPAGGPAAWICDPLDKIFENATPPEKAPESIRIETARNEYESAQIAVRGPLKNVTVTFRAPGPVVSKFNFVGFIAVSRPLGAEPADQVGKAPGRFPDLLSADAARDVPADTTQPIWLTFYTPKDAAPGTYQGEVQVQAEDFSARFPIEVTVWPITIPEERHLYVTNWFFADRLAKVTGTKAYSDEFYEKARPYFAMMAAHRQNVTWTPWNLIQGSDFSAFDRFVETLEKHGLADRIEITHLGGRRQGKMGFHSKENLPELLKNLQEHLREKGWLQKTLLHVSDEAEAKDHRDYREMVQLVKKHAPEIKTIDAILSPFELDAVDVPVPVLHLLHRWEDRLPKDRETWFYTCVVPQGPYPNRLIQNRLIDTRVLHWINRRYHMPGYLHWAVNFWNDKPFEDAEADPSYHGHLPAGDMWIMYPGPLSSIRWEAMRDGIEDYELLRLLDRAADSVCGTLGAKEFDATALGNMFAALAVPDPVDRVKDPELLRSLRRRAAQTLIALESELPLVCDAIPGPQVRIHSTHNLISLRGVVPPGTTVRVNGLRAKVTEDGRFWSSTQIRANSPNVVVEAEKDGLKTSRQFSYWVSPGTAPLGTEHPVTERDRMTWLYFEGVDYLSQKEHVKSAEALTRCAEGLPKGDPLRGSAAYNAACCYALLGKIDDAFAWLEKAAEYGWRKLSHAENDGDLVELRKDKARWEKIRRLMK